jgi:KUP system potassium uptake protein
MVSERLSGMSGNKESSGTGLKGTAAGIMKSLGLVFGDIGTSPLYTLAVIFLTLKPTEANVFGVMSLIVWTMTILVTVEYAWLAMSLGEKREGGTIVLRSILLPLLKKSRSMVLVTILTFIGVSLLIGDGVITPAISILSAVEGIVLIPPALSPQRRQPLWSLPLSLPLPCSPFRERARKR